MVSRAERFKHLSELLTNTARVFVFFWGGGWGKRSKMQLKLHKNGVLTKPGAAGKVAAGLKSKLETFK